MEGLEGDDRSGKRAGERDHDDEHEERAPKSANRQ
jgi:hypothetical protein